MTVQALTDVQTRHPEIAELANMLHVLKHQLNKKREEEMKIDFQVVDDDCKGPNREYSSPVEEVMLWKSCRHVKWPSGTYVTFVCQVG